MMVILKLLSLVILLSACSQGGGGGGGGSSSKDNITFEGIVLVTPLSLANKDFNSLGLSYAHVNLCKINSDNQLVRIGGTSIVIAGTSGKFKLSINEKNVPKDRRIIICVS